MGSGCHWVMEEVGSGSIPEVGRSSPLNLQKKSVKKKTKIVVGHGGLKCGSREGRYNIDMLIRQALVDD